MFKNILLDFDGTIVDTSEGIIKCMNYGIDKLSLEKCSSEKIKGIIGPPLEEMFKILLNTNDKELINRGVLYFRERHSKEGLYELELYSGVKETLQYLFDNRINLVIVTSKPYEFTKLISEDLGIKEYFKWISGVNLKGNSLSKQKRIEMVIEKFQLKKEETIMIGDRAEDIVAANKNGIKSVGILYGFGTEKDLKNASCSYLFNRLNDIKKILFN